MQNTNSTNMCARPLKPEQIFRFGTAGRRKKWRRKWAHKARTGEVKSEKSEKPSSCLCPFPFIPFSISIGPSAYNSAVAGPEKITRLSAMENFFARRRRAVRYGGTAKQHEHDWKIRFFPLLVAKLSFGILREGLQRVVARAVGRGAGFLIRRKLEAPKTKW